VISGKQGGRTPDIDDIARVILENNLAGTAQLVDNGISINNKLSNPGWEEAVKDGKLVEYFKIRLDKVKAEGRFTEKEIADTAEKILNVLKKAGTSRGLTIQDMKTRGLNSKNALINPALNLLHYQGKIKNISLNRNSRWIINNNM
jgi:hypothetical protein